MKIKDYLEKWGFEKNLTYLDCYGEGITSLEGIEEYSSKLTTLDIAHNPIKSLKGIEKCNKLESVMFDIECMEDIQEVYNLLNKLPDLKRLPCGILTKEIKEKYFAVLKRKIVEKYVNNI